MWHQPSGLAPVPPAGSVQWQICELPALCTVRCPLEAACDLLLLHGTDLKQGAWAGSARAHAPAWVLN